MTLSEFLYRHPLFTLVLMVASALSVGTLTLNIFYMLSANWDFISRRGLMAFEDGAGQQLLELSMTGSIAMMAYLLFKVTEGVLVEWIKQRCVRKSAKHK